MLKTVSTLSTILSGILLFSTLVCGLWIRSHRPADESSLRFHAMLGISTVAIITITFIVHSILIRRLFA